MASRPPKLTGETKSPFDFLRPSTFFTPAFVIQKVAFSLTTDHLVKLYLVILGFLIITVVSAFLAYLPARLFQIRTSDRRFCLAVAMFMNFNSLPIAMVTSILGGGKDKMNGFEWGSGDTHDQVCLHHLSLSPQLP